MKFGVYLRPAITYEKMLDLAFHVEDLGYYGVFLNDHIHGLSPGKLDPYLEAWTAITGIGVQTSKLMVGHITLFNSLRNPAYLAKSATALDNMTGGRYELILGAGWNETEYLGYDLMEKGKGMPSAGERVTRLKESVQIIKGMFSNEVFSYNGKYWKLKDAQNLPQPTRKPFPVSVGARQPRMIRITAKYADGINASGDLQNVENILRILLPALEHNSKSVKDFFISGFAPSIQLLKDEKEYKETLRNLAKQGINPDKSRKYGWIGTPEALIEKWRKAVDMGMSMSVIQVKPSKNHEENKEMLAKFKDEVATQI